VILSPNRLRKAIQRVEVERAALDRRGKRLIRELFEAEKRLRKAREMQRAGASYGQIGAALGTSRQRAHQLLNPGAHRKGER
jgi:hypothetical protein